MGEVIPLFEAHPSRATAAGAAERIEIGHDPDPLTTLLAVTKYWEIAIAQIGRCQISLPAQSKGRLNVELATLETKLRALKSLLDEHKRKCPAGNSLPDELGC